MLTLLALAALSTAQLTADDDRRPRVPLCTAQEGELDRVLAVRRADDQVWWFPMLEDRARPYDLREEMTAYQRDWHRYRLPLTVDGLTYHYAREDVVDNTAFRRYNWPIGPIDRADRRCPGHGPHGARRRRGLGPAGARGVQVRGLGARSGGGSVPAATAPVTAAVRSAVAAVDVRPAASEPSFFAFALAAPIMATPKPEPMAMPIGSQTARLSVATPSEVPMATPIPMPIGRKAAGLVFFIPDSLFPRASLPSRNPESALK